jgi:uncharacterized repeat protein (TIGR03803 family)
MTSKNVMTTDGVVLLTVLALVATLSAQTQTLTVLHNFTGPDGIYPQGTLLFDQAGNLYGTTSQGGTAGYGTVFKLDPSGNESVLASFGGSAGAGTYPLGGLVRDTAGNLYGTTADSFLCQSATGCGNVFKLDPNGTVTVLHRFGGTSDGANPTGRLVLDSAGNLYGTTHTGGGTRCKRSIGSKLVVVGCGTVFKIDASGQESVLHPFEITDGVFPSAGLVRDTAGNLFGTAYQGGLQSCTLSMYGCGTVFKVDTTGTFSVLYSFKGPEAGPDGAYPQAGLTLDSAGNLFSTTAAGGSATGCPSLPQENCGTIFQLTPAGTETALFSFKGGLVTAGSPTAGLTRDAAGNFYGLAGGTIFKLDRAGKEFDLYTITGSDLGVSDDLVLDANGNLYGVTPHGSSGFGTVFKLTTPPDFAIPAFTLTPASVSPGSPASAILNLAAVSGFTDTVAFTCSVSPKPALAPQCSVTPASAAPGTPVTVKVTTTGPSARMSSQSGRALYAMWLPLLGLMGIGNRLGSKQRKTKALLLGCVLVGGLLFQAACGGSSMTGSSGTPAGAYTITVTGTSSTASGSLVRSTSTTLEVQ